MGFFNLDTLKERNLLPGVNVRFFHTDNMTVAHWIFEEGAELPKHSHPHEQTGILISGRLRFNVDGEIFDADPGDSWCLPGGIEHSAEALEDSAIIEVFSPVREDFLP